MEYGKYRTLEYLRYLESPEWWAKRRAALERAGYICERCRCSVATDVHHRSYLELGSEPANELEALCDVCHKAEHHARNRAKRVLELSGQQRLFDRWHDDDPQPRKRAA